MTRTTIVITAVLALVAVLPVASAQAQSPRTFVSAAGSDANPCTFAAPCRHFQAAVNATTLGGEVDALDPAGYGPIVISQAITIEGQGWSYIAPPAGGNGITINAVSGNVSIHGVSLNGVGITGTTSGIVLNSASSLTIRDSVIRNFTSDGIGFFPNTSNPFQLSVANTLVSDNGGNGINLNPAGSGTTTGVLSHVALGHNTNAGLNVGTSTQTINVTVADSVSANNSAGVSASSGGTPVSIMVRTSTIANNTGSGLQTMNSGAQIRVTRSTITGNGAGWSAPGGAVTSYADNNIDGNTTVNTAPPAIGYK